jgi:TRAP-type C4-dicarboxylate transport system substrate-binding protein
VGRLSHGRLQIRLFFDVAGDETPDIEERLARMVRDGRFDLGWVATRVWDELEVKSFRALQAPFLVTDYELLGRVATGPIGRGHARWPVPSRVGRRCDRA